MSDSETTRPRRHDSPAASPLDDDDLLCEILLRLPPQPSFLPRASLVSKRWCGLVSDAAFLLRFRAHHRKPPLLGLFDKRGVVASFFPVLAAPDRIPPERLSLRVDADEGSGWEGWRLLGCRHGRVLILSRPTARDPELLVCSPVTGARCRIALPREFDKRILNDKVNGAVLCPARDDQGPFKVVLVCSSHGGEDRAVAHVYSSQIAVWGNPIFTVEPCAGIVGTLAPSTLAGNALYWWLNGSEDGVLEFRLDTESLAVVRRPAVTNYYHGRCIQTEGGGLGFVVLSYPYFQIWDRNLTCSGDAVWKLRNKKLHLQKLLQPGYEIDGGWAVILGYAEDADAIFVWVDDDAYMVQLGTMQSTKLPGAYMAPMYHAFTSFYTPGTFRSPNTATAIEPPKQ